MLTDREKNIIFRMIRTGVLPETKNDEIRGNDEAARELIAGYVESELVRLTSEKIIVETKLGIINADLTLLTGE